MKQALTQQVLRQQNNQFKNTGASAREIGTTVIILPFMIPSAIEPKYPASQMALPPLSTYWRVYRRTG